jgi:hypothetical protein
MLAGNPRTSLMAKNIARMADADRTALRAHATTTLNTLDTL